MAETAFYFGMIDMSQRIQASIMQLRAAQLIADGENLSMACLTEQAAVTGIMPGKAIRPQDHASMLKNISSACLRCG